LLLADAWCFLSNEAGIYFPELSEILQFEANSSCFLKSPYILAFLLARTLVGPNAQKTSMLFVRKIEIVQINTGQRYLDCESVVKGFSWDF
jgi:hypothetical protein